MIKILQEVTDWGEHDIPNGIYHVCDGIYQLYDSNSILALERVVMAAGVFFPYCFMWQKWQKLGWKLP